jgi:hypothetical protein
VDKRLIFFIFMSPSDTGTEIGKSLDGGRQEEDGTKSHSGYVVCMGSSIEKVQRDEGNGCIDAGVVVSLSAMQEKGREGPDDLAKGGGASDNAPHVRHVPLELSDRSLATLAAARGSYKTRYIEECSSVYVFVVFLGSSAFTITQLCVVLFKVSGAEGRSEAKRIYS